MSWNSAPWTASVAVPSGPTTEAAEAATRVPSSVASRNCGCPPPAPPAAATTYSAPPPSSRARGGGGGGGWEDGLAFILLLLVLISESGSPCSCPRGPSGWTSFMCLRTRPMVTNCLLHRAQRKFFCVVSLCLELLCISRLYRFDVL